MIVKSTLPHIRDMLSRARKNALRIGVSVGALLIALIHVWKPHLQIDSITMVLLVISVLPWQSLIRSIELPGVVRLELRELRELAKGASQDATLALTAAGAIGHLGENGRCGSMMSPKIINMALTHYKLKESMS